MARGIYDPNNASVVATVQAFSWVNLTQKPTAFPPLPHTHLISDITGLSTALATFITTAGLPAALAPITYTSTQIDGLLLTKANAIHFHDDLYYRKPYVDAATSPSGIDTELYVLWGSQGFLTHIHDERYYTKGYIDNVLNETDVNLVNDARYYTKPEVDQEISNAPFLTAPAAENLFYTQTYIDAALATLGDGLYVFTQTTPSTLWNIDHQLGRYPNVNVIVSGELAITNVIYPDNDHITVTFYSPQSGSAYLT